MGEFPETAWSMISQLHREPEARREALERLCRDYWRPVQAFLERGTGLQAGDADDLAQGFFSWVLESGDVLQRFDPSQGSFRSYLRALLRNFVRNEQRGDRAVKRGGRATVRPLDALPQHAVPEAPACSPEEAFDLAWVEQLIERGTQRVRRQLSADGRSVALAVFEAYEFPPPGVLPSYASVAEALQLSPNQVRHQLYSVRERVRTEIRAELLDTVRNPAELDAEWGELFPPLEGA